MDARPTHEVQSVAASRLPRVGFADVNRVNLDKIANIFREPDSEFSKMVHYSVLDEVVPFFASAPREHPNALLARLAAYMTVLPLTLSLIKFSQDKKSGVLPALLCNSFQRIDRNQHYVACRHGQLVVKRAVDGDATSPITQAYFHGVKVFHEGAALGDDAWTCRYVSVVVSTELVTRIELLDKRWRKASLSAIATLQTPATATATSTAAAVALRTLEMLASDIAAVRPLAEVRKRPELVALLQPHLQTGAAAVYPPDSSDAIRTQAEAAAQAEEQRRSSERRGVVQEYLIANVADEDGGVTRTSIDHVVYVLWYAGCLATGGFSVYGRAAAAALARQHASQLVSVDTDTRLATLTTRFTYITSYVATNINKVIGGLRHSRDSRRLSGAGDLLALARRYIAEAGYDWPLVVAAVTACCGAHADPPLVFGPELQATLTSELSEMQDTAGCLLHMRMRLRLQTRPKVAGKPGPYVYTSVDAHSSTLCNVFLTHYGRLAGIPRFGIPGHGPKVSQEVNKTPTDKLLPVVDRTLVLPTPIKAIVDSGALTTFLSNTALVVDSLLTAMSTMPNWRCNTDIAYRLEAVPRPRIVQVGPDEPSAYDDRVPTFAPFDPDKRVKGGGFAALRLADASPPCAIAPGGATVYAPPSPSTPPQPPPTPLPLLSSLFAGPQAAITRTSSAAQRRPAAAVMSSSSDARPRPSEPTLSAAAAAAAAAADTSGRKKRSRAVAPPPDTPPPASSTPQIYDDLPMGDDGGGAANDPELEASQAKRQTTAATSPAPAPAEEAARNNLPPELVEPVVAELRAAYTTLITDPRVSSVLRWLGGEAIRTIIVNVCVKKFAVTDVQVQNAMPPELHEAIDTAYGSTRFTSVSYYTIVSGSAIVNHTMSLALRHLNNDRRHFTDADNAADDDTATRQRPGEDQLASADIYTKSHQLALTNLDELDEAVTAMAQFLERSIARVMLAGRTVDPMEAKNWGWYSDIPDDVRVHTAFARVMYTLYERTVVQVVNVLLAPPALPFDVAGASPLAADTSQNQDLLYQASVADDGGGSPAQALMDDDGGGAPAQAWMDDDGGAPASPNQLAFWPPPFGDTTAGHARGANSPEWALFTNDDLIATIGQFQPPQPGTPPQ